MPTRQTVAREHSSRRRFGIFALTFVFASLFFIGRLAALHLLEGPPGDRDEIFFDIVAINLAAGNGFSGERSPAVLDVYGKLDPAFLEAVSWTAQLGGDDTTTFRPPLYPFLLSAVYRTFGHSYAAMRCLNSLLLALGAAFLYLAIAGRSSAAGIFLLVALAFDPHLFAYTRIGISEALAFPLTAAALAIPILLNKHRWWETFALGCTFGLLLLARPVFLFWIPAACLTVARRASDDERRSLGVGRAALLIACVCLCYLPWAIRNCLVLGGPHPFGSQGGIAFGEVYYERADVSDWDGNWNADHADLFHHSLAPQPSGLEREREAMLAGTAIFRSWLKTHTADLPRIWASRAYSLWWRDAMPYQRAVCFLGLLSLIAVCKSEKRFRDWPFYLLCHTVAICFAYNARGDDGLYGRFLGSVYPILFLSLALGASLIQERVLRCQPTDK